MQEYANPNIAILNGMNGMEKMLVTPNASAYKNAKIIQIIRGIHSVEIVLQVMTCFGAYSAKACPIPLLRAYG